MQSVGDQCFSRYWLHWKESNSTIFLIDILKHSEDYILYIKYILQKRYMSRKTYFGRSFPYCSAEKFLVSERMINAEQFPVIEPMMHVFEAFISFFLEENAS